MLHCNKYLHTQGESKMDWQSLVERLHEMFPVQGKSDLEQFIESKNPQNGADVEHWLQQWTYHTHRDYLGL
jgi:hypothetical protein